MADGGVAHLRVATRGREERRVVLEWDEVRIGRSADNEIAIPDLSLSRVHAQIIHRDGQYYISDRGSRNGTFLNGQPVQAQSVLADGDEIRLGETVLIFRAEGGSGVRIGVEASQELSKGSVAIPAANLISSTFRGQAPPDARVIDVFARASRMLIAKIEAEDVYKEVLEAALDAVLAERGTLMLLEGPDNRLVPRATRIRSGDPDFMVSRTIVRVALEEKRSVITTDAQIDPRFDAAKSISMQGVRAAMCSPLWLDDRVTGLLYVDRRFSAKQFNEADLSLLTVIANLTAAKIDNLRLLEDASLRRKLEEELSLAADIQKSLLPREDPSIDGWQFAGTSIPSRSVGGDLFDYLPRHDGRLGLVVADVSGKGMSAALLMASLQANLRAFAQSSDDLAAVMREVNRALCSARIKNKFATIFYADLDPKSGRCRYVNAGHNPGLIVRRDGSVEWLSVGGMIAGAFAELARYTEGEFEVRPADVLVLYSDGVTEAASPAGELFGEERLVRLVSANRTLAAPALRDAILDGVAAYTQGGPLGDDTTLLVGKRLR